MLSTALLATERHHAIQRRANRAAVIRRLCARPDSSAPELAIELGFPMAVVAPLLRQLMVEGLALESRGRGTASRRLLPRYRPDPAHVAFLGADVEADQVRVVATSLAGHVLGSTLRGYGRARSAMSCIDALATASLRVWERLGTAPHIVGMGLGLPRLAGEPVGDSRHGAFLRTRDVPFAALLAHEFEGSPLEGTPIFPGDAADVAALGEFEFGPVIDGPASLLYLSLEDDLHAGIVVDGQLLPSRRRSGSGAGHTILQPDGPRCACGRSGCAKALIGPRSLLGTAGPDPVIALRRKLDAGLPDAVSAVARAGACLGTLLHNLAVLYRPSRIVVGGPLIELGDALLLPARRVLGEGGFPGQGLSVKLSPARFGRDAVAVGAAALASHRLGGRRDAPHPAANRSEATCTAELFLAG